MFVCNFIYYLDGWIPLEQFHISKRPKIIWFTFLFSKKNPRVMGFTKLKRYVAALEDQTQAVALIWFQTLIHLVV